MKANLRTPVIFLLLGMLGIALSAVAGEAPWVDAGCKLSPQDRSVRREYVAKRLGKIGEELAVVRESQATVRGGLAYMNHGYLASDILAVSSSALLFATGYEGLVLAFKQSEITVLAGSTLPTSLSFTRSFYMLAHGYHVQEGQIDWSLRNQIQKLTAQPIRTDAARGFLSSPRCGKGECPTDQPEIEQLIQDLNSWHEDAAKSHADTDGVLEAWSNTYGKLLGLADLPWLDALVSAMELKKSYYQTLDHILEHDGKSCAL